MYYYPLKLDRVDKRIQHRHTVRVTSMGQRERPLSPARSEGRRVDLLRKDLRTARPVPSHGGWRTPWLQTQQLSSTKELVSVKLWVPELCTECRPAGESSTYCCGQHMAESFEDNSHQQSRVFVLCDA